jgi:hypothetical protein
MTETQKNLWTKLEKLSSEGHKPMTITRSKDKVVRDSAKIEGSFEWAVCEGHAYCRMGKMPSDDKCQNLLDILTK